MEGLDHLGFFFIVFVYMIYKFYVSWEDIMNPEGLLIFCDNFVWFFAF